MGLTFFGLIAVTALVFALWTLMMFITLFTQRARAKSRTGKSFPGPRDAIREWQHWWRSPDLRLQRILLITLTLLLIGLSLLFFALLPTGL